MRETKLVLDARAELGECPRWHAGEQALYWVDIVAQRLHRLDPTTGETRTRTFYDPVACFAFRPRGGFVLGMRTGFGVIDSFDGEVRPFGVQVEAGQPTRFNDGRTDAKGRFWAGTVDSQKAGSLAKLYRLGADGAVTQMDDGALTANGAAFSPDNRTFYWSDTPRYVLFAYDFDLETGTVSNRRAFHQFPDGNGRPDGGSVDEEGFYWSALYAGGRVVRLSPQGEIVEEVPVPAQRPTMISFGGQDRRTAYVTTAREKISDAELEQYPLSGGLFSFRVETPGLPEFDFGA
jgi:sugar lactone lactonase YvrE